MQTTEKNKEFDYSFLPEVLLKLTLSNEEIETMYLLEQFKNQKCDSILPFDWINDIDFISALNQLTNSPMKSNQLLNHLMLIEPYYESVFYIIQKYNLNTFAIRELSLDAIYDLLHHIYSIDILKGLLFSTAAHNSFTTEEKTFVIQNVKNLNDVLFFKSDRRYLYTITYSELFSDKQTFSCIEYLSNKKKEKKRDDISYRKLYLPSENLYDDYDQNYIKLLSFKKFADYLSIYKMPSENADHLTDYYNKKAKYEEELIVYETEYENYQKELNTYNEKMKRIKELQDLYGKEDYPDLPAPCKPEKPVFANHIPYIFCVSLSYKGIKLLDFIYQYENNKNTDCKNARLPLKEKLGQTVIAYGTYIEKNGDAFLFKNIYSDFHTYDHMWFYDIKEPLEIGTTYQIIGEAIAYEKSANQGTNYGINITTIEKFVGDKD